MPELSDFPTLKGEIRVFDGNLSKTQFEEIWDKIEERINSDLVPEFAVVDDDLDKTSKNPVRNEAIATAIDRVYRIFPTVKVERNGSSSVPIDIWDGGLDLPLDNVVIEFGPVQSGSGDPSSSNVRPFNLITSLPTIDHLHSGEDHTTIHDYFTFTFSNEDSFELYAGQINFKTGKLWPCRYYSSYADEELVGPWVSSMDVYSEESTPTTGAAVIDLGDYREARIVLTERYLKELSTCHGLNQYSLKLPTEENPTPWRDWSLTYRADPDLYVVQAVGLTTEQKDALITLLDD